jgi:lipoyl(octanoyl) transferase
VRTFHVHQLGPIRYAAAHALQERLLQARIRGEIPDTVLLLEHDPPVLTLGRSSKATEHVLLSREALDARGFDLHETGRGGDVTYHGPGQLVGYPIVDLAPDREDVRRYVRDLEEAMIRTVAEDGIRAGRTPGQSGTWVGVPDAEGREAEGGTEPADTGVPRKIGAVGVRLSRWVTMHGFALNVTTDLSHFDVIVPCGIRDKGVTSIARETGLTPTVREVGERAARHLASLFDAAIVWHEGVPDLPEPVADAPG